MLNELKEMANYTSTENRATTYVSTNSECLDLFATIGALRRTDDSEVVKRFIKAYSEDADMAMKILFYARDVRGGLGERRIFRIIMCWLADNHKGSILKNLDLIAEYGRYDDLLVLLGTACKAEVIEYIRKQLVQDERAMMEDRPVSLLGKWLPSVNTSNNNVVRQGKYLAKNLEMTEKDYRKLLSALRAQIGILENNLRERDYSFDYAKQPSKALYKYQRAFMKNDQLRYISYLDMVSAGKAKMNTGTLTPYDVIAPIVSWYEDNISEQNKKAMDVTWNALEDFTGTENALVVVDGSGSMYMGNAPLPAAVAQSLAIYFAEHNKGEFKNHFITFSENPRLVEIKGRDIYEKVMYCHQFNEVANTNLQKVFELILTTAVRNRMSQEEMPAYLYIISDMEFDCCINDHLSTNFDYAKKLFAEHNYKLPQVIFWNVDSRNCQQPVKMNEQGVTLVSGSSPRVFQMISTRTLSPYAYMMEVLGSSRYESIVA